MLRTKIEDKIENARKHIRNFVQTLDQNKNKYSYLIEVLTQKLQLLPNNQNNEKQYMFDGNNSVEELEKIFANLNEILRAVPGQIAKVDFQQEVEINQNILIPSLEGLLPVVNVINIDPQTDPWINLLKTKQIEDLKNKLRQFNDEINKNPNTNYISIRTSIDKFELLKNQYIDAFKKAIRLHTDQVVNEIIQKKIGDINRLDTSINDLLTTSDDQLDAFNDVQEIKNIFTRTKKLIDDFIDTPVQITSNLLTIGKNSGVIYQQTLDAKIANIDTTLQEISPHLDYIGYILHYQYNRYTDHFYKDENEFSLRTFANRVQTEASDVLIDNKHVNLLNILDQWEASINLNKLEPLANNLAKINQYKHLQRQFKNVLATYNKTYITNKLTNKFKEKLINNFVKNQIGYALGGYKQTNGVSFLYSEVNNNSLFNYSYDENINTVQGKAAAYLNDIAKLLNEADTIIYQDETSINDYGYAIFMYEQIENANNNYNLPRSTVTPSWTYDLILSTKAWKGWNHAQQNMLWIWSLLGSTNDNYSSVSGYEMITYLLMGLIHKYEELYRQQYPNTTLDKNYWNPEHTGFKNVLTTIQKAYQVLDIFGVNTYRRWNGFSGFIPQYQTFTNQLEWNPNTLVPETFVINKTKPDESGFDLPEDFAIYNYLESDSDNLIPYTLDKQVKIIAKQNSVVDAQKWIINAIINISDVYQELFKEMLVLNEQTNHHFHYIFQPDLINNLIYNSVDNYKNALINDFYAQWLQTNNIFDISAGTLTQLYLNDDKTINRDQLENDYHIKLPAELPSLPTYITNLPTYTGSNSPRIINQNKVNKFVEAKITDEFYMLRRIVDENISFNFKKTKE
ncbi:hypothetical protein OF377_00095 [Ureaplasma sp. ES3154-GEN]|uniref:hypothetical protein n=1 Tax=Ureaplasma sp. ES3154-GEN TaxID=2984844 RepID=UPI0021E8C306|nr:hypothetical protein [Ureaplasma sp. ES3154-GEN]MCV3743288.1 hypothetical protein [Ureaplasma sp. ES3154-GEN]